MKYVDADQVFKMLPSVLISFLMATEEQLPPHSRQGREIKKLQSAIADIGKLIGNRLDEKYHAAGVASWNAMVIELQRQLEAMPE